MFRIKMNLANPNTQLRQNMPAPIEPRSKLWARPVALNAPMIDRVHKARPGCSACGKKVS
jgi:hypothetical protein